MADDRRYPARPILGVGGILLDGDAVLLVERGTAPLKGEWSLPGGVVEVGELLEDAVRREVLEETGIVLGEARQFEIFERIMRDDQGRPEYHYVLVDFLCTVSRGAACAGSDASACRWVRRSGLAELVMTEGTLGVIERAFAARANHPG